ncbi:MAG: stage III sporulation protein AB [Oscillospiraceae bacterium]|nr:stage III sporulation protein AB [Oscillospiraceae bacterium]
MFKWIGAALIICGCGFAGYMVSSAYRREEQDLRQLICALDYMSCELQYRRSPLPDLCRLAGTERSGCIGRLLINLAKELESQISPDVQSCLAIAAATSGQLPRRIQEAVCILGSSLGRFDLEGQLQGLEAVRTYCREQIEEMSQGRDIRLRSYQTLGLCAGAALAILFV